MANNFEAAAFALQCAFPKNKILMDDKGMPSVFVWIPAFRLCDVLSTTSTDIHPAFRVNGKEIAGFYFGKYQTKVYNERAYSLPAEDPTVSQNFDWFASKTKANGTGWHEATVAEWAAVALWCHKRGCEPRGNNNYGKDANESTYDAITAPGVQDSGKTARVLTGTGPLPWSHNGQMDGIWDMNGNVWEWLLGLRLYKGELHIIADNNAADNSVSTAASSAAWKAIRASDGALITPDGNGTTSGSIKLNVVSGKAVWDTTITDQKDEGRGCSFKDITAGSAVGDAAKLVLMALALMPDADLTGTGIDTTYGGDYFWFNNGAEERLPNRGGLWGDGGGAGLFALSLGVSRAGSYWSLGGRSAFVELPAES